VRAQNAPPQKLFGHIPVAVRRLTPVGRENGSERLNLAIGLPLRNQQELTNLLRQIYDPASQNYHHYLTPQEFTERFGPTEADYQAVIRFARQNGFTVTATHPNRLVLDVQGRVTDIERTLHVTMRMYRHPTQARMFHAPDTEPMVDLAVPILHISGLDNYSLPHPKSILKPLALQAKATPNAGSGPSGTYRGNDFRAAYSVGPLTGAGQTVALLQFDGYYANDIATYETQAGLPSVPLVNVPVDGGVSTPGDGDNEVSLDIEMVVSMAPGVSKILVYEAPNPSPWVDLLSRMANDNLARQIGCSWGGGGPDPSSEQIFLQMAAQGQSFFNATGDSDAFTGLVDFPSDSTNITEVGGTTLSTTGPGGSYLSETVWNWGLTSGQYVGSSGGVSTTYAIPPWQQGVDMSANQGSTTMRNVPDVAMTGDNVYVVYGNGLNGTVGGTSCAAPLWAGFTALVNQQAATAGQPPVGFLNPALYSIGKSGLYSTAFHDVTTGNNFNGSSPAKYSAAPGYDLCTGWGTPSGANLINALLLPMPIISGSGWSLVAEGCFPTNGAVDSGETVTVNFTLKNSGFANTTNVVATLLATNGVGLPSGPQSYGALTTNGAAVSQPFTFTALGSCGSTITAAFQLQDGTANLGLVNFTIPVGSRTATFIQNFDSVAPPSLPAGWTTFAGGSGSTWNTSASTPDTAPNAAFTAASSSTGSNVLVSPIITLPGASAGQLVFRNIYSLQASSRGASAINGGVLEIKIGSGSFTDILAAGGSFVSGGYNRAVSSTSSNPLAGRQCWSGNSGGYVTTLVDLPDSAAGQPVQFRWICGSGSGFGNPGSWDIDSIAVSNLTCCSGSVADLSVGGSESSGVVDVSSNVTFTLNVTNLGPDPAGSVVVTDSLPAGLTFATGSSSQGTWTNSGNVFIAFLGTMANQAVATLTVSATAGAPGQWNNSATVSSQTPDSNTANNSESTPGSINSPPTISTITNVTTVQNATVGPIGFVIGDAETPASALVVSANSSDPSLIDPAHILFGGSDGNRTVTLTPLAKSIGACTVTIFVSDGMATTGTSFTFTVNQATQTVALQSIPDFTILEKDTLTFTNSASESGQQSPPLTFTLSNAPAGAAVDPNTGRFTWTPTEAQGPGTNQITVFVADNSTPPLISAQTFSVVVLESNEPPVLAPVADRMVHAGMTVTVTNSATDPDIPTNTLTFSLNSAAPDASIDAANGVFVWTPDGSFANTTNNFTVVVTDDNPSAVNTQRLSVSNSFNVIVVPPPTFSANSISNGVLTLTWSSISGQTYRVQYTTNLAGENWTDLTPDVIATGATATASDTPGSDAERFYRILVVP